MPTYGSVLMQVSGLVWALGQLSQTDALFSPWVATLSHTQSSGYVPPLRLPRLKPKESRDPVICVVNTLIATEASALLVLFILCAFLLTKTNLWLKA